MHLIVTDLEWTCTDDGSEIERYPEIIEIGAVAVSVSEQREVGEFQTFVRPRVHRRLTKFCIGLTTISQYQVDTAPGFLDAFRSYMAWMEWRSHPVMVSWGRGDLQMIHRECDRFAVGCPIQEHINLAGVTKQQIGTGAQRRAMRALDIKSDGTRHRAIDDARNYAKIVIELLKLGWAPTATRSQ